MKAAVIGGGIAGLCTALDLTLRGIEVEILEVHFLGSGTTTKCAGMLHSGARYVNKELDIAQMCSQENLIIKRILPYAVGNKQGLFVATKYYDQEYTRDFESNMRIASIEFEKISGGEARALVPTLSDDITVAYLTPEAVINPYMIVEAYRQELIKKGVTIFENFTINTISKSKSKWVINSNPQHNYDVVVNATGSWANDICNKFGIKLNLTYIHGSMAIVKDALVDRVVTACAPNRNGDVIIPSGNRTMFGSTWHELDHYNPMPMSEEDKQTCVDVAAEMVPKLRDDEVVGSFTGIRTYENNDHGDSVTRFAVKRNSTVIDHTDKGADGIFTALSGKLSLGRLVAEEVTNLICKKYGINQICITRDYQIPEPKAANIKTLDIN